MTYKDAIEEAIRYNKNRHMSAVVVRILPRQVDPVIDGDNGWDVEITCSEDCYS